jgi:predicted RNA-binding protein (virulence factor B family)
VLHIGQSQTLTISRSAPVGLYLICEDAQEVLLPNKFVTRDMGIGQHVDVFVYKDSEDRIVATTEQPYMELGDFEFLEVVAVNRVGAFADWGLDKHLLIPFREQNRPMVVGGLYLVHLYLDQASQRLVGSTKTNKFLQTENLRVQEGQKVWILCSEARENGMQVIVDNRYRGIVYHNEGGDNLQLGERLEAYISKVRPEGLLDIRLNPIGRSRIPKFESLILEKLQLAGGSLPYGDKSSPEAIQKEFGLSKKAFKESCGALYKKGLIRIENERITKQN